MLYGYGGQDEDGPFMVITAAISVAVFKGLSDELTQQGIEHHVADGLDFLTNDRVRGMAYGIIIDGPSKELAEHLSVTLVHRNRAVEQQREMANRDEEDIFDPKVETRSIKEIFGLDKHDPWAPPPKPEDEAKKKKEKDKKIGDTTGDSFGGPKDDKVARVTDTRVSVDANGEVTGVDILAVKGLHDKDEETPEVKEETGPKITHAVLLTDAPMPFLPDLLIGLGRPENVTHGPGWIKTVDPRLAAQLVISLRRRGVTAEIIGAADLPIKEELSTAVGRPPFAMFFRLDVADIGIEQLAAVLEDGGVKIDSLVGLGETDTSAWVGVSVERLAKDYEAVVQAAMTFAETEVYAVNLSGVRMAPKGTNVLDPNAVPIYGPRPWSDPVAWALLSEEDRAAEMKAISGAEFIFTGSHTPGKGTTVIITPKSYFDEHQEPWEGEIDPYVADLLAPKQLALVKQDNFTYLTRSIDFATVVFVLAKQGMLDSMQFRMWMNLN